MLLSLVRVFYRFLYDREDEFQFEKKCVKSEGKGK